MASYRKLASGLWNAQVRIKGHKALSASFETKVEAEAWATEQMLSIKSNKLAQTLYELGDKYCSIGLRGKSTQQETILHLRCICTAFKNLGLPDSIDHIKQEDINTFRVFRLNKVAPATCRKDLMLISRIYRWAKREYLLDIGNPVDGVSMPPNGKPRNRVIEPHELELLISALPPVMAIIVEVAYETAMRRSEIVKLTPRDLHLGERYLSVIDGK